MAVAFGFALAGVLPLSAAPVQYDLNVANGFNFQSNNHNLVGFITSLTIGPAALAADFSVTKPTGQTNQVVAVLQTEDWAGNLTDGIQLNARISTANKQAVNLLLQQGVVGVPVQFSFQIFAYDGNTLTWYQAFYPQANGTLTGFISQSFGTNLLTVAATASTDVTSPVNYDLVILLLPNAAMQELALGVNSGSVIVKSWGPGVVPPAVTTTAGPSISGSTADLAGAVTPQASTAAAFFEYSTSSTLAARLTSATNTLASSTTATPIAFTVSNLNPQTTCYYRAVAINSAGKATGNILAFDTIMPAFSFTGGTRSNGIFQFNFANASNVNFSVLASTNLTLAASNWPVAGSATQTAPGQYHFADAQATNAMRFYRLRSP
jgi:hypothetical protein